ncbi:hypothetical protein V6N11_069946 [Hibiscus sabdariffa]|uniref:Uncharacterized protein n=2 Tax=Hibiscus sabdariffa TaxID=183260 RepID=A0ABR2AG37_9ROSI
MSSHNPTPLPSPMSHWKFLWVASQTCDRACHNRERLGRVMVVGQRDETLPNCVPKNGKPLDPAVGRLGDGFPINHGEFPDIRRQTPNETTNDFVYVRTDSHWEFGGLHEGGNGRENGLS